MTALFLAQGVNRIDFPRTLVVILGEVDLNELVWGYMTPLLFVGVIHFLSLHIFLLALWWVFFPFKQSMQNQVQYKLYSPRLSKNRKKLKIY